MTPRLVIVEDHGLIAETVGTALRARGFETRVVDAVGNDDVVGSVADHDPDLVLLDLELGTDREAIGLVPELTARGVTVLMMTGVTDPVRLARCVRAGAVGIVDKAMGFDRLCDAVERTLERGTLLDANEREEHLGLLRRHEAEADRRLAPFRQLTPREDEVLRLLCQGRSVDEIAAQGGVSVATVRTQVKAILRKLGVGSQLAATALARESGWVQASH